MKRSSTGPRRRHRGEFDWARALKWSLTGPRRRHRGEFDWARTLKRSLLTKCIGLSSGVDCPHVNSLSHEASCCLGRRRWGFGSEALPVLHRFGLHVEVVVGKHPSLCTQALRVVVSVTVHDVRHIGSQRSHERCRRLWDSSSLLRWVFDRPSLGHSRRHRAA